MAKPQYFEKEGFFSSWSKKILCFLLALILVFCCRFLKIGSRKVVLPLKVTLPENYKAVSYVPENIEIAIKGSESVIYLVDPDTISAYADFSYIDRQEDMSGKIVRVPVRLSYPEDIFSSDGLVIESIPSSVRILFEAK